MLTYVAAAIVIVVYAVAFRLPLRRQITVEKRSAQSQIGIVVVSLGFAALFVGRPRQIGLFAEWRLAPAIVASIASVLTALGAGLMVWSRRTLGKQWSFSARVVEGHQLITRGPYSVVRNPIYSSVALLLVSLGLAFASPLRLATALALYFGGTMVRVRAEEEVLHRMFGEQWEAYRRRVPALIPWL